VADETYLDRIARGDYPPDWPRPGEVWRHYKGNLYEVVAVALWECDLSPCVVYRSRDHGHVWVRPVSDWLQRVRALGEDVPRFVEVED
jgi:hypothetical protein